MDFTVIIPARYASSRLPGKPLINLGGRPMIAHVYERALASGAEQVIVATDDERIAAVAEACGATAVLTSAEHGSGTERLAEAARSLAISDDAIIVNLQGDEPLMPPSDIRQVATNLAQHTKADVATLCTPIRALDELFDPHVVKVVVDGQENALYFSRAPIPWDRDDFMEGQSALPTRAPYLRHIGLYAYRTRFLHRYAAWSACPLEQAERLEQLRILWNGGWIHVGVAVETPGPGVDTADDRERVEMLLADLRNH